MQNKTRIFLAVAIAALIVVIAMIVLGNRQPETVPAAAPEATQAPETTEQPEATQAPEESEPAEDADEEVDDATMYEGALAGLTEEEIGALAMAEEHVSIDELGEDGVD